MSREDNRSTDEVKWEQVRRWARKARCLYDRREKGYCRADKGRWESLRGVDERKVTMVTRTGHRRKKQRGKMCQNRTQVDIVTHKILRIFICFVQIKNKPDSQ